jgi:hypothetical protein
MLNFLEYREHFRQQAKWCKTQIQHLQDKFPRHFDAIVKLDEYRRDCLIMIRRIDLTARKYKDFKLPTEVYDDLKGVCMYIRFFKHETLDNYLKAKNISTV